ncbi:glucosyl-3-phosphoglycerate synthase [Spirillospora sp. CA-128828]|uniref:glucosyl-3-phosphoglycerate synthase n=1 Tax=Spirillospora sp. CA-128828 TaxID=3240033 RepID=UPI003D93F513
MADLWFHQATSRCSDWPLGRVLEAKQASALTVSVVIPARDEAATVGAIVERIVAELAAPGVVDEVVVMDSDSRDGTGHIAAKAGARVHRTMAVAPEAGWFPGKGEALWKSLFVTRGDVLVFVDADLTVWSSRFVVGLLGPLLTRPETLLVKAFYRRLSAPGGGDRGGRVTELMARPMLNLLWPELATVVQPLAGEWAVRRSLLETLPIPVGYGVELACLLDTYQRHGLTALAQVDLGARGHRQRPVEELGVMAAELLAVVHRRRAWSRTGALTPLLRQFDSDAGWTARAVPTMERSPARSEPAYYRGEASNAC